ncbi:MAG TPA: hypothetical protein VH599_09135 [Ktedonobacterales bacterium]
MGSILFLSRRPQPGNAGAFQPTSASAPKETPTATPENQQSYFAVTPGPDCDSGSGDWSFKEDYSALSCTPSGLKVSSRVEGKNGQVFFRWPGHAFPQNYSIEADASNLTTSGFALLTCAGIDVRDTSSGSYGLFICQGGTWKIDRYDAPDFNAKEIASGSDAKLFNLSSYHLKVSVNGTMLEIRINGGATYMVNDTTYLDTDNIGFTVDPLQGNTGSAVFSNFSYTPG